MGMKVKENIVNPIFNSTLLFIPITFNAYVQSYTGYIFSFKKNYERN